MPNSGCSVIPLCSQLCRNSEVDPYCCWRVRLSDSEVVPDIANNGVQSRLGCNVVEFPVVFRMPSRFAALFPKVKSTLSLTRTGIVLRSAIRIPLLSNVRQSSWRLSLSSRSSMTPLRRSTPTSRTRSVICLTSSVWSSLQARWQRHVAFICLIPVWAPSALSCIRVREDSDCQDCCTQGSIERQC